MSIFRPGLALLMVTLLTAGIREAAAQAARQAPAAANLSAQPLKLIPMPRELGAGALPTAR